MIVEITDDFDLEKIAESGQCFRWQKLGEEKYRIIHEQDCLIMQKKAGYQYEVDCSEEEYRELWMPYLDLDENYEKIRAGIDGRRDPFLAVAADREAGIRILRQSPWEALISFMISQNRNIPAIKKSIEMLAALAGSEKRDSAGEIYYTFPTPLQLSYLSIEELNKCKLGYRSKYIKAAAEEFCLGKMDFQELQKLSDQDALQKLTALFGVGVKVATCVMLYGLHRTNAFPVDVWVKKILAKEYASGYPMEAYAPYNGIYQQYMFAYYRKKEKEEKQED